MPCSGARMIMLPFFPQQARSLTSPPHPTQTWPSTSPSPWRWCCACWLSADRWPTCHSHGTVLMPSWWGSPGGRVCRFVGSVTPGPCSCPALRAVPSKAQHPHQPPSLAAGRGGLHDVHTHGRLRRRRDRGRPRPARPASSQASPHHHKVGSAPSGPMTTHPPALLAFLRGSTPAASLVGGAQSVAVRSRRSSPPQSPQVPEPAVHRGVLPGGHPAARQRCRHDGLLPVHLRRRGGGALPTRLPHGALPGSVTVAGCWRVCSALMCALLSANSNPRLTCCPCAPHEGMHRCIWRAGAEPQLPGGVWLRGAAVPRQHDLHGGHKGTAGRFLGCPAGACCARHPAVWPL